MTFLCRPLAPRALSLLAVLAAACQGEATSTTGWAGSRSTSGDTAVVVSRAPMVPPGVSGLHASPPRIVWADDRLARPAWVARDHAGRLLVADGPAVFVLAGSGEARVVGRAGDGPGEFRRLTAVAADTANGIVAWDGSQYRLNWFDSAGTYRHTVMVIPPNHFEAPKPGNLVFVRDSVLLVWSSGMTHDDGPPDSVLVVLTPLDGGVGRPLLTLPSTRWRRYAQGLGPRGAYDPKALYSVDGARVAFGDGQELCYTVLDLRGSPLRACRDWARLPVQASDRAAAGLDRVDASARTKDFIRDIVLHEDYPDTRSSYERLLLDDKGRVWLRLVDSACDANPMLRGSFAELRPPAYTWSVFGPDGRWIGDVRLSSAFDPMTIAADTLWGKLELDDGALAIAEIAIPPSILRIPVSKGKRPGALARR